MVTITKLQVDVENKQLMISAKSKGEVTEEGHTYHHRFTKVYIDVTDTFNCYNEWSTNAAVVNIPISEEYGTNGAYDSDLVNYSIPFSEIYSNDIENDILFVWLEEVEYDDLDPLHVRDCDGNPDYGFGVVLSVSNLYQYLLDNLKINSEDCCNVGCSEVNMMLAWQGFSLAKTIGDYKQMIYYWKILHNVTPNKDGGCNCH